MSNSDKGKIGKKDDHLRRDTLQEIESETRPGRVVARYGNPNRDRARGDWDRTNKRNDEGMSREEEQ